ncbi:MULTISPECIES: Spy/CpxP family protein refolding chaperone [unclassified Sinorhizobium]|uniref:Spy/CpxP family protein refolding chaperone n=1 Tax=unclassified Sinorhizobium TaxID=2613772 RepID=UPI0024C212B2|nr:MULTISPECIES: Spy/CpxP family protein refolding chaperone [unclassified Sinorhizobium]MDK1373531.1 Spy/CpxP family protein refolding chaperone [Sinorhizobium sp. 6-70]MDK1482790.1 Spy/CpxP family protein refolding chaperone [Sinorhizobium sp. 6-117]
MENEDKNLVSPTAGEPASKGWGRRAAIGGLATVAVVGAVGFAAARSDDFGFGMGRFGMGGHMMHAHMGGGGFMEHRIDSMFDELDTTPEQEDKLWDIIDKARGEIRPTFRDFRETREEVIELLGAPTLDRAAAEKLRSERIATIDEASRKMTTALLDAAEVLTPEQRAKLVKHLKERRGHGRW